MTSEKQTDLHKQELSLLYYTIALRDMTYMYSDFLQNA